MEYFHIVLRVFWVFFFVWVNDRRMNQNTFGCIFLFSSEYRCKIISTFFLGILEICFIRLNIKRPWDLMNLILITLQHNTYSIQQIAPLRVAELSVARTPLCLPVWVPVPVTVPTDTALEVEYRIHQLRVKRITSAVISAPPKFTWGSPSELNLKCQMTKTDKFTCLLLELWPEKVNKYVLVFCYNVCHHYFFLFPFHSQVIHSNHICSQKRGGSVTFFKWALKLLFLCSNSSLGTEMLQNLRGFESDLRRCKGNTGYRLIS